MTGLWEWYEFPPALLAKPEEGEQVTWASIMTHWRWVVVDFRRFYGVDLADEYDTRSWRWFVGYVRGLLRLPDSLLRLELLAAKET